MTKKPIPETPLRFVIDEGRIKRLVERGEYAVIDDNYHYETWEEVIERLEVEIERLRTLAAEAREQEAAKQAVDREREREAEQRREDQEAIREALRAIVDDDKADDAARVEAAQALGRFHDGVS